MIQGRPCGTPGAKWQAVGRSMHGACGEGKDGGNKTIVLPGLAFWVQISTAFITGAWYCQTVTAKGR